MNRVTTELPNWAERTARSRRSPRQHAAAQLADATVERGMVLPLSIAIHALVDLMLWSQSIVWSAPYDTFLLAIPVAQNGLVASWAARAARHVYWRISVVLATCLTLWHVACVTTLWSSAPVRAQWAMTFLVQAGLVMVLDQWGPRNGSPPESRLDRATGSRRRFSLSSLCLFTTLVAVSLGLGRLAAQRGFVPMAADAVSLFVLLGACFAVVSWVVLRSTPGGRVWGMVIVTAVSLGFATTLPWLQRWAYPSVPDLLFADLWVLFGGQAVITALAWRLQPRGAATS